MRRTYWLVGSGYAVSQVQGEHMKLPKQLSDWLLVAFLIGQAIMTIYIIQFHSNKPETIRCDMSEFHPDFTADMKKECRLLRSGRWL
jgi:hypothetical protein